MSETSKFLGLPYIDRQQIIFVDDLVFDAQSNVASAGDKESDLGFTTAILKYIYDFIRPTTGELVVESIKLVLQAYEQAKRKGLRVRMAPKRWIPDFHLPAGHSRDAVLYIAHPVTPTMYLSAADFHRVTFEHKFAELLSF